MYMKYLAMVHIFMKLNETYFAQTFSAHVIFARITHRDSLKLQRTLRPGRVGSGWVGPLTLASLPYTFGKSSFAFFARS